MKKLVILIIAIISMLFFSVLFNSEQMKQINNMEKAEQSLNNSITLLLPSKVSNSDQQQVYNNIKEVLDKYKANAFYSKYIDSQDKTIKYVYLSNTDYFKNFKLSRGRFLTLAEMNSTNFLSTKKTGDSKQIGEISSFAGTTNFEIRTLKGMVQDKMLFDGYCTISLDDSKQTDSLIKDIESSLKVNGIQKIQQQNIAVEDTSNNFWIIVSLYFIIMLLVLYNILKSYKSIGVEKLLGFSAKEIWIKRLKNIIKIQTLTITVIYLILIIYKFKAFNQYFGIFLTKIIFMSLLQVILLSIACSIPFLYIEKIKISNMLKNKQPSKEIIIFNIFTKSMLFIIFIILLNQGVSNFSRIQNVFTSSYKEWGKYENFFVIPNIHVNDINEINNDEFIKNQKKIYIALNHKGAIFADFSEYIPSIRKMRLSETHYDYERDFVRVNPNYLKNYPIYDTQGNVITIPENSTDYTILVPEKYKPQEINIKKLYQSLKNENQSIKIIWTKSNQKLFSFLIEVNPDQGNFVTDPIIIVLTEANGTESNYDNLMGVQGNPFKIKVDDPMNPRETIIPVLDRFGYGAYANTISRVNEQIASESEQVKNLLSYLITGMLLLGVFISIIIIQNIYAFYEQFKKKLVVRHLQGYKITDKYFEYYVSLLSSWPVIFLLSKIIGKIKFRILSIESLALLFIELLTTTLVFYITQKKKIIETIKGS